MQPAIIALVLAASAPESQASCSYSHAGYCVGNIVQGATASADGVFIVDMMASDAKSGAKAPSGGMFMPGCMMVREGAKATEAGSFWAAPSQEPATTVAAGDTAASNGVFCPSTAGKCAAVAKDAVASADGVFTPDGEASPWASGGKAPTTGFFCKGCMLVEKGAKATADGMYWSAPSATAVSVASGATAPGGGMFCKAASGGAASTPSSTPAGAASGGPASNTSSTPAGAPAPSAKTANSANGLSVVLPTMAGVAGIAYAAGL